MMLRVDLSRFPILCFPLLLDYDDDVMEFCGGLADVIVPRGLSLSEEQFRGACSYFGAALAEYLIG